MAEISRVDTALVQLHAYLSEHPQLVSIVPHPDDAPLDEHLLARAPDGVLMRLHSSIVVNDKAVRIYHAQMVDPETGEELMSALSVSDLNAVFVPFTYIHDHRTGKEEGCVPEDFLRALALVPVEADGAADLDFDRLYDSMGAIASGLWAFSAGPDDPQPVANASSAADPDAGAEPGPGTR